MPIPPTTPTTALTRTRCCRAGFRTARFTAARLGGENPRRPRSRRCYRAGSDRRACRVGDRVYGRASPASTRGVGQIASR
ncbi:competence ComEA helix-hairpin-helix region domain protein [Mycobacterium xenopi 3993]|nr:competence ComEA helix-hairpin-helix region domain protein [Mycobacterium xenopi 3993]